MIALMKRPSAWVPIALSLTALAAMFITMALSGPPVRESDEGTAAHLFQLWLLLEAGMITIFTIKWMPKNPQEGLVVVTLQIMAVLAACAPVAYFHL